MKNQNIKVTDKVVVENFENRTCFVSYINYKTDKVCFSEIMKTVKPNDGNTFVLSNIIMQKSIN